MKRFIGCFCLSIMFQTVALAKTVTVMCPEKIETHQSIGKLSSNEWTAMSDQGGSSQWFDRIGIFDGNPKEKAALIPDNDEDTNAPAFWTLKNVEPWMACYYHDTTVALIKALPASVHICSIKKSAASKSASTLTCE